ncbi:MAG: hypothetical protein FJ144_02910 [Deltaproteobacteria bacterium]|nr:hypothetical protein [Deltaproteobacteria bacterium]
MERLSACAIDRDAFSARVQRFTGATYGPIRGLCICKEAAYPNRAGVVISAPGPAGNLSGIALGCAVALFHADGSPAAGSRRGCCRESAGV